MALSVLIAGGGPAGSSLAIRLARHGHRVTLVERERFPRQKLCGEFLSPECSAHFTDLGVGSEIGAAGGERITRTRFYAAKGRSIVIPSKWFGTGDALSLSRSVLDTILLNAARSAGAEVVEGTSVASVQLDGKRISSVGIRSSDSNTERIAADIFIDATGRSGVITKLVNRAARADSPAKQIGRDLVAFKAHLSGARPENGCCEIYSFPGGYGGLSGVGDGLSNHCFVVDSRTARELGGSADEIVRHIVFKNRRAADTLCNAEAVGGWLAVSIAGFGVANATTVQNVYSVGDAAAFIDPFTGSGMLMALESSSTFAECVQIYGENSEKLRFEHVRRFKKQFSQRLRIASALRAASRSPLAAEILISLLGVSGLGLAALSRSTRRSHI